MWTTLRISHSMKSDFDTELDASWEHTLRAVFYRVFSAIRPKRHNKHWAAESLNDRFLYEKLNLFQQWLAQRNIRVGSHYNQPYISHIYRIVPAKKYSYTALLVGQNNVVYCAILSHQYSMYGWKQVDHICLVLAMATRLCHGICLSTF